VYRKPLPSRNPANPPIHQILAQSHKKDGRTGKRYAIYVCSNRERGFGCDMPRVQAHSKFGKSFRAMEKFPLDGMLGTDELLASELEHKLTKTSDFVSARISEAIKANQTDEKKIELAAAEKAVRDLERKKASYETAIGNTDNTTVILSLTKKLEEVELELSTARTKARIAKKEFTASVDPDKAAEYVQKEFEGFAQLPLAEQIAKLERHVDRIIYNQPVCAGDFFNLDVRLKVFATEGVSNDFQPSNTETALSLCLGA
jgi:hypothetical protein